MQLQIMQALGGTQEVNVDTYCSGRKKLQETAGNCTELPDINYSWLFLPNGFIHFHKDLCCLPSLR